jgi:hypothetical protein
MIMKQIQKWFVSSLFLTALIACDGSSEDENNAFEVVLAVTGGTLASNPSASSCNQEAAFTPSGLIFIGSRLLEVRQSGLGKCTYVPSIDLVGVAANPQDIRNRVFGNAVYASFPQAGRVVKINEARAKEWAFGLQAGSTPDALLKTPGDDVAPSVKDFCPTQITLSGADQIATSTSESLLVILDDPAACSNTDNRNPRVAVINANTFDFQGIIELSGFSRGNSPVRIAASNANLFAIGANAGSQYIMTRVPLADIGKTNPAVSTSDPLLNLSSSASRIPALGFSGSRLFASVGDFNGRTLEITATQAGQVAFGGADVLVGAPGSSLIGGSKGIFWNRANGNGTTQVTPSLTVFARDNDTLVRRTESGGNDPQSQTVSNTIIDAMFPPDGNIWGLQGSGTSFSFVKIDPFNFPTLSTSFASSVSSVTVSSIAWLIPTSP